LQRWLQSLGFDPGSVDGDFGRRTEDALEAAQSAYGLDVTGEYDWTVWAGVLAQSAVESAADAVGFGDDGQPTAEQLADLCLAQVNTVYSNKEVGADDTDPDHFDCSELLEWACRQLKVDPPLPDWSTAQIEHCEQDFPRSVSQAKSIRAALLYWDNPGEGMNHVALSLGDGEHMVDANGTFDRVCVRKIDDVPFQRAGLIPGIRYPDGS
jgi:peptidoglycan hydrolase-like protein with peptidoglycan-binding domain